MSFCSPARDAVLSSGGSLGWTLALFWLGIGFMVVLLRIHAFLSIFCRLKWKLGDEIRLTGWLLSRLKRGTLRPWLDGMYGPGFVIATLTMDVVWPLLLWTTWTLAKPRAMSKAPRLLLSKALLFRLPDFLLFSVSSLPLLFSHHIRCPLSNARSFVAGPFHNLLCWPNCSGLLNGLYTQIPISEAKSSFMSNQWACRCPWSIWDIRYRLLQIHLVPVALDTQLNDHFMTFSTNPPDPRNSKVRRTSVRAQFA